MYYFYENKEKVNETLEGQLNIVLRKTQSFFKNDFANKFGKQV